MLFPPAASDRNRCRISTDYSVDPVWFKTNSSNLTLIRIGWFSCISQSEMVITLSASRRCVNRTNEAFFFSSSFSSSFCPAGKVFVRTCTACVCRLFQASYQIMSKTKHSGFQASVREDVSRVHHYCCEREFSHENCRSLSSIWTPPPLSSFRAKPKTNLFSSAYWFGLISRWAARQVYKQEPNT